MTEKRQGPEPCHYDRTHGRRVTKRHRDDCRTNQCHGCAPCTAPHCTICGRGHITNEQPQTCPKCLTKIRADLADLEHAYHQLGHQATDAGHNGKLVAAAPIPGGDAQVLRGPTVKLPLLRTYAGYTDETFRQDNPVSKSGRPTDPIPPLAVLAQWEDIYRSHLGHAPAGRASLPRTIGYLTGQLPLIAQIVDGPDFLEFTRQLRHLRAACERALHDEQEPERGVECFECGDKLVRRFRTVKPCRHDTPARRWLRTLGSYGLRVYAYEVQAARLPCAECDQGGIKDPGVGMSWECPGCRKSYDPGEYSKAVRRDLLEAGDAGDGWTHITIAADAATTLVGLPVPAATVRKWAEREKVGWLCQWRAGVAAGLQLVYWPDVAEAAVEAVDRAKEAAARRQRRDRESA